MYDFLILFCLNFQRKLLESDNLLSDGPFKIVQANALVNTDGLMNLMKQNVPVKVIISPPDGNFVVRFHFYLFDIFLFTGRNFIVFILFYFWIFSCASPLEMLMKIKIVKK